ncbi:MAG: replication-associated recombination protein A [Gammaproteobacteria bacterium]|nr:replication-associated recombination protein A [Gammaproteobacteria bacterium]
MDYKPLAEVLRPKKFDDIIGQDYLVGKDGIIRKMIENNSLVSIIMYGNPGVGKTTIAKVIADSYPFESFFFSASSDTKATLKQIIDSSKLYHSIVLIIDEIHRMNKDIQDYLLSFMETGKVIVIGMTTVNPYISVNPAIRSRCNIFKLNDLEIEDIKKYLYKIHEEHNDKKLLIDDEVFEYISNECGRELRVAINDYELLNAVSKENDHITVKDAENILRTPNLHLDKNGDNYYNLLSALQKSIRGSDVHAAIYYLARLIKLGDLNIILRRLISCAFEDIGLANPTIPEKVTIVAEAVRELGLPEARLPLANLVIEMALSPKSNSAMLAIDKALSDIDKRGNDDVPDHLINIETYTKRDSYIYPHDFDSSLCYQQYLPKNLEGRKYYIPNLNSKYESQMAKYYEYLEEFFKKAKATQNKNLQKK